MRVLLFDAVFTCIQFILLEDLHGSFNFAQVVCSSSLICLCLIDFTQNLCVLISLSSGSSMLSPFDSGFVCAHFTFLSIYVFSVRFPWVCVCPVHFIYDFCMLNEFFSGFVWTQFI